MSTPIENTGNLAGKTILYVLNDPAFFLSHRLNIALAAKARGMQVGVATPAEADADKIRAHGLDFYPIKLARWSANPLGEANSLVSLVKLYRELKPDIVHHVTIKPVIYGSFAARAAKVGAVVNAISGLGQVFTATGIPAKARLTIVKFLYARAFAHSNSRAIFQNKEDRDYFLNAKLIREAQSVLIAGAGVDINVFTPVQEPNTNAAVVFASRLLREKGVYEFVEAAKILKQRLPNAKFILAGLPVPGNPGSISEQDYQEWKSSGIVECLGHQSDMRALIQGSAIVCLPSAYGEGIPKILIEAASCGRAIVTTDWPGCRDIVQHEVNGLLVEPRNPAALAKAIEMLLTNPALRARYGAAGREKVLREGFAEEAVVDKTMSVYSQALANNKRS